MLSSIRIFLLIVGSVGVFYLSQVQAAIDPKYKECTQRGYQLDGNYCVFPDGSRCLLDEFNEGECGEEFMTNDYCVPEGRYVWDGPCCEGLVAYLPPDVAGQATCVKYDAKHWFQDNIFLLQILGLIIIFVIPISIVVYRTYKRR